MAPDLNSLPASRASSSSLSARPRRISLSTSSHLDTSRSSPPSPSLSSLQAAATINASLHHMPSNTASTRSSFDRRRSSLLNNLSINDPTTPSPGELQQSNGNSPRRSRRSFGASLDTTSHGRQLRLGELHQELENEQEAQVNRLLHMIRLQQDQLAALSRNRSGSQDRQSPTTSESAILQTPPLSRAASTPTTEHSRTAATPQPSSHFHRPHSHSRRSSSRPSLHDTSSRGASPALRPVSGSLGPLTEDFLLGGTRDECAFYQAETQTLTRENQMLKHRIRELERQIEQSATPNSQPAALSPLASPEGIVTKD